jgi:putative sterol carrier protein
MSSLPPAGTKPKDFFEQHVPRAFAGAALPEEAKQVDVTLGVKLEGEGGGEWRFHLKGGELQVESGPTEEAAFTVIPSVQDWRGALWEGRGGAFGKQSRALFEPDAAASGPGAFSPTALAQLQALRGVIKMVVSGGADGDWAVAFKLGPGAIPAEPTTTVSIGADDAAALERGELDPMQAFMAGRIQVTGDMTLLMQMQAIQMQAAAMAAQKKS